MLRIRIREYFLLVIALLSAAGVAGFVIGCVTRGGPLSEDGEILTAQDVDTELLRARLDTDGDNRLDVDLPIVPLTFNHSARIVPYFEQSGLTGIHQNMNLDTGGVFTIPAGHSVSCLFNLLTSEEAMRAHGLLVLQRSADAAGIPEAPDIPPDDADGPPVAPGQQTFASKGCTGCHGQNAEGGFGPKLSGQDQTDALQERFGGGADHNGITLTDAEIADVAAWLQR